MKPGYPRKGNKALRKTGATCRICGLRAGNSLKVEVHRYSLRRSQYPVGWRRGDPIPHTTLGTIGLCDQCIAKYAEPSRFERRKKRDLSTESEPR